MYEKHEQVEPAKTERHLQLADEMSQAVLDFSSFEQNELIKRIYANICDSRKERIDCAEKEFIGLKDSLKDLQLTKNPE